MQMNKILIKNTRIVDANKDFKSDLLVEDGKISRIDTNIDSIDAKIINGENYILMPSFIDMHTHLRDPGLTHKEDLETGQRAALKGGFTVYVLWQILNQLVTIKKLWNIS